MTQLSPIILGFAQALKVFAFIMGVRGGGARRQLLEEESRGARRRPFWVPLLRIRDWMGLLGVLVPSVILSALVATHLIALNTLATVPGNFFDDALAAPDVVRWVGERAESPARNALLEITRTELEGLTTGQPMSDKEPAVDLLFQTIEADAVAVLRARGPSEELTYPISWTYLSADADPLSLLRLIRLMALLSLFIVLGSVLGARVPSMGRWLPRFVPGGVGALAPVGGLMLAGFLAALFTLTSQDHQLDAILRLMSASQLGLEAIPTTEFSGPDLRWAWSILVGVLIVQAALVVVEFRREGPS